jgi:ABC-type multidrug transport system fused ATPase/permease subunit
MNVLIVLISNLLNNKYEIELMVANNLILRELGRKMMNTSFDKLEDPYYLDLKEKAIFAVSNQGAIYGLFSSLKSLLILFTSLVSFISILLNIGVFLPVIILFFIGLKVFIYFLNYKKTVSFYGNIIPINRKAGYYLNILLNPKYEKDFRFYSIGDVLRNEFSKFQKQTIKEFFSFNFYNSLYGSLTIVASTILNFLIYLYVSIKCLSLKFGIPNFSLYLGTAIKMASSFEDGVQSVIKLVSCANYLNSFRELLLLDEDDKDGTINLRDSIDEIKFENVNFKYPKSDTYVLKNISFTIKKGEKISVVGLNGAGKTTLIKLICRLYPLEEGVIYVNNIDISKYKYSSYIHKISTVFQDFKLFAYSLRDNISFQKSDTQIDEILDSIDFKRIVHSYKDGLDTFYGKEFEENGIEMSLGQIQKMAIARCLAKDASLIILDEPTASLDPISEAEIYEKFAELVKNSTSIFISHRMSSSTFADKILVINEGVIEDFDSHKNLMMKKDSIYCKLFNTQKKNYEE